MKLIISGDPDRHLTDRDMFAVSQIKDVNKVIICGKSKWARSSIKWAKDNNIPTRTFRVNGMRYGPDATTVKTREMIKYADAIIIFPGKSGTDALYDEAVKANLDIYDYRDIASW